MKMNAQLRMLLCLILPPLTALYLVACGGVQTSLDPAGPQSLRLSRLWWLMFYVCSLVFLLVIISTGLAIRQHEKFVEQSPPGLNPPQQQENRRRNVVITMTTITLVIMFGFLIFSFSVGRSMTADLANKNAVTIEIIGHQWWWEVRYLDANSSNIFTTANEIHIPVGVPVTFNLHAADVIHSFWVPNLSGKKDLIPGKDASIWLQADRAGSFRGQCAEYCGVQHAHMALWIIAEPQDQFNAWRQNQTQTAVQAATDSERRGQQVFLSSSCVMCHSVNGTPAGSNIGPNLTHVASRTMIAAATLQNTRDHLQHWVTNSQAIKPGNKMPQNDLSPEDLNALLSYLQSLK